MMRKNIIPILNTHHAHYRRVKMASRKKELVTVPDSIKSIVIKIIDERARETSVNDIINDLGETYSLYPKRKYINWTLYHLVKDNKIIRVNKGGSRYNPAIYKAKPHDQ